MEAWHQMKDCQNERETYLYCGFIPLNVLNGKESDVEADHEISLNFQCVTASAAAVATDFGKPAATATAGASYHDVGVAAIVPQLIVFNITGAAHQRETSQTTVL